MLSNKFSFDWLQLHEIAREWHEVMLHPMDDLVLAKSRGGKRAIVKLVLLVMLNCGCRKTAVLDDQISFMTFSQYMRKLRREGLPEPTVFRLGDETSPIKGT